MNNNPFSDRIKVIAESAAHENKVEFIHSEVAGSKKSLTVRVYIDKTGGVTVEDCSAVSRKMEAILDADDFIPDAYILEVSSPGLERELYNLADFVKYAGSPAKVRTHTAIDGQRNFKGKITAVEGDQIIFADKTAGTVRFPYAAVAKANLEIDIDEELKGK